RRRGRLPRTAVASAEAAPGRRRRDRRGGRGRRADTAAHARPSGPGRCGRRDRGRLVQLAGPRRGGCCAESGRDREGVLVTVWSAVLLAACICGALKASGCLLPASVLEAPRPARISDLLTVALLGALVAVQSLGAGQAIVVDARVPAVLVAAGLLWMRQSFLVVVFAAAAVAALLRLVGWAA